MLGKDVSKRIKEALTEACKKYFQENLPNVSLPEDFDVELQITRDSKHGDLSSNLAMRLASLARVSPQAPGKGVIDSFRKEAERTGVSDFLGGVEFAGGFINIRLSDEYYRRLLVNIYEQREDFGRSDEGHGAHVNLEYVSANPTGPLTVAHGRQAAIGDALSRILRFSGYEVTNEYYLNDMGRQINLLGESLKVRYGNLCGKTDPMPEDGYMGDYIIEMAKRVKKEKGEDLLEESPQNNRFFRDYAVDYMMDLIRKDLEDFGVRFDVWTSQAGIEERKEVEETLEALEKKGFIFEEEGAKWFASSRFGDDKDRVVVKSDGFYTYLAPDIAYHNDKYSRGYTRLIDLLGPDHHGYIKRMKAAVQALGREERSLDILIVQLVTLLRGGEAVSMSTRKGEFVSLREILDELGKDIARFVFLSRRLDSHLDFDIELLKKESADNPVYYIQYAHARICSIKKFRDEKYPGLSVEDAPLGLLGTKEEKLLMRKLGEFPFAVKGSADALEPNRLIVYLNELARCFHSFYAECRVVTDEEELTKARLYLVECVQVVLTNGLSLLDIALPESM
jgi:arginyl-tRNA synthetase